jgi:FAD/FMN-containing dehydrogenase
MRAQTQPNRERLAPMTVIHDLQARLGGDVVLLAADADTVRHMRDFAVAAKDPALLIGVAYPRTTEQVSEILKVCHAQGVAVVPQGGMTGLAGGGAPTTPCLALSLERMRAIEEIDPASSTMTVQAGVILETAQTAASEAGFMFPLDLGARGSSQVGGNASTNAGGNRVLRYGMMRDLILGLEVVLADGTVMTSLNKMIKNNAGYDLKQIFIGAEGTLGIITRLVLKLHPKPRSLCTALCAAADYDRVLDLLQRVRSGLGGSLSAFEVMWPEFYEIGTTGLGRTPPLPLGHGQYVLVESMGGDPAADQERFEAVLGEALEDGVLLDAVIAQSDKETQAFWAIRDAPAEFRRAWWPQIAFDVSIPTGQLGAFRDDCTARLDARWPGVGVAFFGHVADSNVHISVKLDRKLVGERAVEAVVYEAVAAWRGSISAEHGIGLQKRDYLHYSRTPEEVALMRTLKSALDPKGILNPGKIF